MVSVPRAVAANLPFNIATPLLIGWLKELHENTDSFRSLTLMVQREVAERIFAMPDTKAYGRLSVIAQWLCDGQICFDVPPSAFLPPPKVTSSIIHLKPKKERMQLNDFSMLEKITQAAFGQRRKMIRSSLKAYSDHFKAVGMTETVRAENITMDQFVRLAQLAAKQA
jgi:16S rRNA (adenine1518-N6/adenine1519-N6)-dimethyltransferase